MKNVWYYEKDYAVIIVKHKNAEHEYLVDIEDIDILHSYKGTLHRGSDKYCYANFYAGKGKRKRLALHRMIMRPDEYSVVDHIDRDPLNNRKENLRLITAGENTQNIFGNKRSETGIRGVSRNKKWGKPYRARLRKDGKDIHLGYFDTIEDAEKASIEGRKKYFPYSTEI